jgi:uroporphyrinogen decarboxylase
MMRSEPYEHVPFDLPMTPPIIDEMESRRGTRDAIEAFDLDFSYSWCGAGGDPDAWRRSYERIGVRVPEDAFVASWGYVDIPGSKASVGRSYHLTEMIHGLSPVNSLEELETLPWHDLDDPSLYCHIPDQVARIHENGRVAAFGLECTIFESAWYLRGMDNLFFDLIEGNPIGTWLLDRFTYRSVRAARAAAEAGADLVRLGDDVGTQRGLMMSIEFWREHLKDRLASVIAATKGVDRPPYIQYHSDGDVTSIVDELIEIGVDVLNPVQPECMHLSTVVPRWMNRLAFSGMIGTQTTMPFGTTSDVEAAVESCLAWADRGARLIVAPTHVLESDVPWENIEALVRAVRRE